VESRVVLIDGGVFDNLGTSCLEPLRRLEHQGSPNGDGPRLADLGPDEIRAVFAGSRWMTKKDEYQLEDDYSPPDVWDFTAERDA
jgi:hypothetical protein